MREIIDFCDICGKGKVSSYFAIRRIFSIKSDVYDPIINPRQYELCEECYKDFKKFLNKKGLKL